MKIAIICGRIPSTTFIENLIRGLANKDLKVLLIGKQKEKVSYKNKNIKNLGSGGRIKTFFFFQKYLILLTLFKISHLFNLYSFSKKKNNSFYYFVSKYGPLLWNAPDIIHVQWAKQIEDWIWLENFGMRVVLSLRGTHINTSPLSDHRLAKTYETYFPNVAKFHCVSNAIKQVALQYHNDSDSYIKIYSGVDLNRIKKNKIKSFSDKNNISILSVGRDHWKKGYNYSILAASLLKKEGVEFHYEIISEESEENNYLIDYLEMKDEVKFIGKLDYDDVLRKMESSDLLILPSVEEGIANVVLEAMAIGLPVISTNCCGMSEVLEDGYNGILVNPRSPEEIFNAIKKYIDLSEPEKLKIRLQAQKTIQSQHNLVDSINQFYELYKELLS